MDGHSKKEIETRLMGGWHGATSKGDDTGQLFVQTARQRDGVLLRPRPKDGERRRHRGHTAAPGGVVHTVHTTDDKVLWFSFFLFLFLLWSCFSSDKKVPPSRWFFS